MVASVLQRWVHEIAVVRNVPATGAPDRDVSHGKSECGTAIILVQSTIKPFSVIISQSKEEGESCSLQNMAQHIAKATRVVHKGHSQQDLFILCGGPLAQWFTIASCSWFDSRHGR